MINIEKSINDILRNIEDIGATKIKVYIFLKICNYLYYVMTLTLVTYKIFVQCT